MSTQLNQGAAKGGQQETGRSQRPLDGACCGPVEQEYCCAQAAKAACCDSAHPGGCGCK